MKALTTEQISSVSGGCPPCIYVAAFYIGGFSFSVGVAAGISHNLK